jgi:multisubunit Na+/H+ antiporter MnhG subunit
LIGSFIAAFFYIIGLVILYLVIKAAVKNGITEAHKDLIDSVKAIERKINSNG